MPRPAGRLVCRAAVLAGLLAVWNSRGLHAGPWPQPEGQGLIINSFSFLQARNLAGVSNPAFGGGTFRRFEIDNYTEYGLTNTVTLSAAFSGQSRQLETAGTTRSTEGFGDVELGARAAVWQTGNWVVAAQGLVEVPTGYDPNVDPALGNGQVDLEPRLLIGRGFSIGTWPGFAEIEAGYRFRLGSPADQLRVNATVGVHPASSWMLMVQSYTIIGMGNGSPRGTDFNLSTLVVSAVYDFSPRWSVQFGAVSDIASRNYNGGNGVFAAVWWKF
jgi:hypothetical protein